jgi:hypothetical protein
MDESPENAQQTKARLGIRLVPNTNPPQWEFAWISAEVQRPRSPDEASSRLRLPNGKGDRIR